MQCISSQESVIKGKQADNWSTRDPGQTFYGIVYSLQSCMVTCPHSEGVNRMMPDGIDQTQGRKRRKHKIRKFMSSEQDAGITSYFQIPMECKEKKLKEKKTSKWHGQSQMGVWGGCGFCLNVSHLMSDSERRGSGRVKTLFVLANIFIYLQDFNQM